MQRILYLVGQGSGMQNIPHDPRMIERSEQHSLLVLRHLSLIFFQLVGRSLLETVAAVQRDCEEIEEQQRVACVLQLAGTADESQESGGSSLFAAMDKDADERRGTWQPLADMFFDEEAQEVDNQLEASRSPGLTDSFDPDVSVQGLLALPER